MLLLIIAWPLVQKVNKSIGSSKGLIRKKCTCIYLDQQLICNAGSGFGLVQVVFVSTFGRVWESSFFFSRETLVCMYYSISNIWQWVCNPGKEVRSAIHNGLKHHSGQVLKHPFANKAALTIRSPSLNFEQRIKAREILWPLYLSECLFIRIRCSILSALVHTYIKHSSSDILVSQKKWAKPRTG